MKIIDLIEKYYVFTLTFIVLTAALFYFDGNDDLVNMIIGAFIGLIAAPVILPKGGQHENHTD